MFFEYSVKFCIFSVVFGSFTVNPPPSGTNCTGNDVQMTWTYSPPSGETVALVNWKKDGNSILIWTVASNTYIYGSGFDASKLSHDDSNGQITLLNVDSTTSGTYSCEVSYSPSAATVPSQSFQLEVIDAITIPMVCTCNTSEINCVLPSPITQVTINNTILNLPYSPTGDASLYVVCMTGDAASCLANSVDPCETIPLCPIGGSGTDGKSCEEPVIYLLFFVLTLVCVAATFFLVIWFHLRFHKIGKVVLIIIGVVVDLLFEIILLWGIEYSSDFKLFNSDINCRVVIIGVVCHVVAVVVEIVKVIEQYLYIEELGARIFVCCRPDGEVKKVRKSAVEEHPSHTLLPAYGDGRKSSSADNQSKTVAKPDDIMLFMHFTVPFGYTVNKWVTEENASIENNPKYVSNDRGTLLIKSVTEKDNGIYQGIFTSDGNEQRVNAVLHVTGQKSANLIINPLIWRQVKTKKLKKISDLKEIRHKVSRNDIGSIPTKNEDESNVSIKSIRWVLNGKTAHTLSNYKDGDDSVPPHTVTKNQPIDEYHCTVEFSNKKSHVYIFIVKFTGVRYGNTPQSTAMHNNKVDTVDDVVGVPTILSTRREETTSSLPPLRHTATTAQDRQTSDSLPVDENNLHPVTARSAQSTGAEENL